MSDPDAPFIAALPMYDFPSTAQASDRIWAAMREHLRRDGIAAPERLTRERTVEEIWEAPNLLLGQTCGYPLMRGLQDKLALIATPVYSFDGCKGANHCSFIVVRVDDECDNLADFRGSRAAINGWGSDTGMNLLRAAIAKVAGGKSPFFSAVAVTDAHRQSLERVANGEADIAAIDCVSYALIAAEQPSLVAGVRILEQTPSSPNLPFVAAATLAPEIREAVGKALAAALADLSLAADRDRLGWIGCKSLTLEDYEAVLDHERQAAALRYPQLA